MSFNLNHKTALAGVYEHPTRFAPEKSMFQIMAESIRGALTMLVSRSRTSMVFPPPVSVWARWVSSAFAII